MSMQDSIISQVFPSAESFLMTQLGTSVVKDKEAQTAIAWQQLEQLKDDRIKRLGAMLKEAQENGFDDAVIRAIKVRLEKAEAA
jgi:uncharacterized protein (UPF0335 family)